MEFLNIPKQLKGKWKNVLFLTYNIDLSFFERTLLREFYKVCRNIIILADGTNYLEACKQHKKSQLLHYINTNYIVEGIFNTNLSHAKFILLTNEDEGKLILGSGNLGIHGYSKNGEIFKVYKYNKNSKEDLEVFLIIKNFIEQLIEKKYLLNNETKKRLQLLFESSPWLNIENKNKSVSIIHNLETNLIEQFKIIIKGRKVEHLLIQSPFYDKDVSTIESFLDIFKPKKLNLLIQNKYTSIEPASLEKIILKNKGRLFFNKINIDDKYIHAKIYLFKLKDSSILIIGSPNLTKNALIKKPPKGNIEIASVLMGKKNEFNELIKILEMGKDESDLSNFELRFKDTTIEHFNDGKFSLLSGGWEGKKVVLYFGGEFPKAEGIFLNIDNNRFEIKKYICQDNSIGLNIDEKAIELLHISPPNPVILEWGSDDRTNYSNPIFIQNIKSLKNFLDIDESIDKLDLLEKVHLEKPEIIDLLKSLNKNLVINDESLWKVSNKINPHDDLEDEEDVVMDYEDINYDEIYKSKVYIQYKSKTEKEAYFESLSPVQVFLNSINKHFEKISNIQKYLDDSVKTEDEERNYGNEEEAEVREEEKKRRSLREDTRLKIIFNNFIKKFLKGISSKNFQKKVDFEIMVKNYMIFNHLILRLFDEDWTDRIFLIKSFLSTWEFFWGNSKSKAYFQDLKDDEKKIAYDLLKEYRSNSQLLAGLYRSINYLSSIKEEELIFELRNFLRSLLISKYFNISRKVIKDSIIYITVKGLNEEDISKDYYSTLKKCIKYETRDHFLKNLIDIYDSIVKKSNFELGCINLFPRKEFDINSFLRTLKEWMDFENLKCYRIHNNNNYTRLMYFKGNKFGTYWNEDETIYENIEIKKIEKYIESWEIEFKNIEDIFIANLSNQKDPLQSHANKSE